MIRAGIDADTTRAALSEDAPWILLSPPEEWFGGYYSRKADARYQACVKSGHQRAICLGQGHHPLLLTFACGTRADSG